MQIMSALAFHTTKPIQLYDWKYTLRLTANTALHLTTTDGTEELTHQYMLDRQLYFLSVRTGELSSKSSPDISRLQGQGTNYRWLGQ